MGSRLFFKIIFDYTYPYIFTKIRLESQLNLKWFLIQWYQIKARHCIRGRSQTTLTRFWPFLTTYPPVLTLLTVWTLTKSGHFTTTYLPRLVNVVCEWPLTGLWAFIWNHCTDFIWVLATLWIRFYFISLRDFSLCAVCGPKFCLAAWQTIDTH